VPGTGILRPLSRGAGGRVSPPDDLQSPRRCRC